MKKHFQIWTAGAVCIILLGGNAMAAPLPKGMSQLQVGNGSNALTVFTYKPETYRDGPLVVVFHGVLRNADVYCSNAIPLADRYNVIIAAPLFSTNQFDNDEYQRGGVLKKGVVQPRTNWSFARVPEIITAIREREKKPTLDYSFIGHSGGGQFLMRIAALYPTEARRIVACNPGSDLFPRRDWKFGYGFGGLPKDLSDDATLQRYLAAPLTLCLGLNDNDPQHFELDRSAAAELQGRFRLERGRNCFEFARQLAQTNGWQFNWRKVEVPGIAHDGKAMLAAPQVQAELFATEKIRAHHQP